MRDIDNYTEKYLGYNDFEKSRKDVRLQVVGKMESTNFLERITNILNDIAPIIIVIGRLIASLIFCSSSKLTMS